ncbi:hypothetical protein ACPA9J_21355 [Pseudomonas aeruginosa]
MTADAKRSEAPERQGFPRQAARSLVEDLVQRTIEPGAAPR